MRILNRVVRWSKHGMYYEADQRHSEIVVREMGLDNAKTAPTAGTREEQKAAGVAYPRRARKSRLWKSRPNSGPETRGRSAEWLHAAIILPKTR